MPFPKAIITKPMLVSDTEYKDLGGNINLVAYDSFAKSIESKNQYVSPRLINWVEPYEISGIKKTLFYTEVNSNLQVGDKVFIINGNYDNNTLIKKDKYKKGRDGYKVLKVENCKIVLDIDYTGVSPYNEDSIDKYIKIYNVDSKGTFLQVNRQITTRGGLFDYKFNYAQNNIIFSNNNYESIDNWGLNTGISGTPGFFVRNGKNGWSNISDNLIYLGSFSVALSPNYDNNGKILIQNSDFEYNGIQFKEGFVYKWEIGPTNSTWVVDVENSKPIITKANFRNGTFNGEFNNGLYGTQESKIEWSGNGTWNGGTILNSVWKSGTMNSNIDIVSTYRADLDSSGYPFQKSHLNNNGGYGYNYVIDTEIESSLITNGNFYNTILKQNLATFSVVENHILSITQSYDNKITKAYFDFCNFENVEINGGELKNTRILNTKLNGVKLVNSYVKDSVLKDSTYIGDGVIKILGYDEWNMSEYFNRTSGSFSSINDVNQKIYKFYISEESFKRLKNEDSFYIKGLRVNDGTKKLLNFFDTKFKLTSWTEFYDDYTTDPKSVTGVDTYSFYKRGYECSAFLSTPEDNSYIINSYETEYWYQGPNDLTGATYSKYSTITSGSNVNKGYSIDIIVNRHDIINKNLPMDGNSEWESLNPKNYNYDSDVLPGTSSVPKFLGNIIDISNAYILDADFESGIIETSDWNSGNHINYNNDVVITPVSDNGLYDLEIDFNNNLLIANTLKKLNHSENNDIVIKQNDIVFLNSIDYDTRGMVTAVTILGTGSSYSTSNMNSLVNTTVLGTTMSNFGTNYVTGFDLETISNGNGTGITVDIIANPIGSVLSITYSAPITNGGSYSMTYITTNINGPIATSFSTDGSILPTSFTYSILTDIDGSITGVTGSTYSIFGPPQTATASGAIGVNVIFATGPNFTGGGMTVNYTTSINGSITQININEPGVGYLPGQIFMIEGGSATFSIDSITNGEITSYSLKNTGEDYIYGDLLEIKKPLAVNSLYSGGITASITITSVTASSIDDRGLLLDITTGTGLDDGKIIGLTISNPGLYYNEGEIFTISGGNLDAIVRIDSVTGSIVRLGDTYKVIDNNSGVISLQDLATQSIISELTDGGVFYTDGAKNRWGYISKSKFDRTKIKSGLLRRAYITRSLIRDMNYNSGDKDFTNYDKTKNLLITDTLFSNNSNILSSATYMYSNIVGGSDIWNDGIIFKSTINGLTFSKGTVKQSIWLDGTFTGGVFYDSRSFNAKPTDIRPNYLSNRVRSYFHTGKLGATLSNSRYSWQNGNFTGGEFYKSDWENGTFSDGLFYNSKFYNGIIENGIIGTKGVSAKDTHIYNGLINYATVNNAYIYANDTSYSGMDSTTLIWNNGVFNNGVFGSNNDDVLGITESNIIYPSTFNTLSIGSYEATSYSQNVTNTDLLENFEIVGRLDLKHNYIGDLIINLMSPNGKIINIKSLYSGNAGTELNNTVFTTDLTKPSLEISTTPYSSEFKFANNINQGVYYKMDGKLLEGVDYQETLRDIPPVLDYASFPPTTTYEGDRYLVIATSSDPNWSSSSSTEWNPYVDAIVEKKANGTWELTSSTNQNGDLVYVKNRNEYLRFLTTKYNSTVFGQSVETTISTWVKSYHSNTINKEDLLNIDGTITGDWKIIIMDVLGNGVGQLDNFTLEFNYSNSYLIKSFKNDAVWNNGIFNGGQFIDLGVWKNGTFNGGKFISTYGHSKSGNYLVPSLNKDEYSWQGGIFNNGEFGNKMSINSTWYDGEFNDGVFQGKLWKNGIFSYGEFKGGADSSVISSDTNATMAANFVDKFRNGYYGIWMGGVVSNKKDTFITDKKIFTKIERWVRPSSLGKKVTFTDMLWLNGTFNHSNGEMKNSVWLDGTFKVGIFDSSSFNPYVKRYSDKLEFSMSDTCIWENGKLINSEFFISKWNNGRFISGTAVGMIWKNGITDYMNAYNIFWENGVWRNGNWNGSFFEYDGEITNGLVKDVLNRGVEWSGTNSCHIWNVFESDADKNQNIMTSDFYDSFASDDPSDYGNTPPIVDNLIITPGSFANQQKYTISYTIRLDGGNTVTETGLLITTDGSDPSVNSTKINSADIISTLPQNISMQIQIDPYKSYKIKAYAKNDEGYGLTLVGNIPQSAQSPTYIHSFGGSFAGPIN